jgi:hypothetical protein
VDLSFKNKFDLLKKSKTKDILYSLGILVITGILIYMNNSVSAKNSEAIQMKSIEEAQREVEEEAMKLKEVTAVYIGQENNKSVIKVGVEKFDPNLINVLPKQIDGYQVIVEETGKFEAHQGK